MVVLPVRLHDLVRPIPERLTAVTTARCLRFREPCLVTREPAGQPASGGNSNGADRSRGEAERAKRGRPRDEASGKSDARSDDTRAPRADASTAAGRARRGRVSGAREASRRSEREERRRSDDTRAWFERRNASFVIPEERSSSVDRGSPIRSLPEILISGDSEAQPASGRGRSETLSLPPKYATLS